MIQRYSDLRVLAVFFKEPTAIHFMREIGREIQLAPPSIKISINALLKSGLIKQKKSKPFNGYIADRENDLFLFYKRVYNLFSLHELISRITESICPQATILFGSYSRGEDIESSDIDILILSKIKRELNLADLEKKLKRKINIMILEDLRKLDDSMIKKIHNGTVLQGEL